MKYRNLAMPAIGILFCAFAGYAQVTAVEGDVKGEDGAPLKDAHVRLERLDMKGSYKCTSSNKKGHYYCGGLPLGGKYKIILEVNGKDVDFVNGISPKMGDPMVQNWDLQALKQRSTALSQAAQTGTLSKEQERTLSASEKEALEKAAKEREKVMAKNKALNDAFNGGKEALNAGDAAMALAAKNGPDHDQAVKDASDKYNTAVTQFAKAGEMSPDQEVIWANLGDAEVRLAKTKTGAEHDDALSKGADAYKKALELKPDDAGVHNNYGLALAQSKKFDEAQAELAKAAQLDPQSAGKYYFNLGALLVNNGQTEPAGDAFRKAIETDPNFADAHYQLGIILIGKAKLGEDGKYVPVAGTREAFEKYLSLKPDGPYAETAKSMIASLQGAVDTSYQNPSAKKTTSKKKSSN